MGQSMRQRRSRPFDPERTAYYRPQKEGGTFGVALRTIGVEAGQLLSSGGVRVKSSIQWESRGDTSRTNRYEASDPGGGQAEDGTRQSSGARASSPL